MPKYSLLVVVFIAVFAVFLPKSYSDVIDSGMQDLAASADFIFSGTLAEAKPETLAGGGVVTAYKFRDVSLIKETPNLLQNAPGEFSFRQFGAGSLSESRSSGGLFSKDSPTYEKGGTYMLFLTCSRTEPILCNTVDLKKGSFREVDTAQGTKALVNGVGNKNLFIGAKQSPSLSKSLNAAKVDQKSAGQGPIEKDAFINMVKGLVETKK